MKLKTIYLICESCDNNRENNIESMKTDIFVGMKYTVDNAILEAVSCTETTNISNPCTWYKFSRLILSVNNIKKG